MRGILLCAALLTTSTAQADEGEITLGLATGGFFTDQLEPFHHGFTVMPRLGVGVAHGVSIQADIPMTMGDTRWHETGYSTYTPRVNFVADAMPDNTLSPFFVAGPGLTIKSVSDEAAEVAPSGFINGDMDFLFNIGAGLNFDLTDSVIVRFDERMVANFGSERFANHGDTFINWETTLGIEIRFGGKDSDGDGITDGSDTCKDEAEDLDGFEDEDGCADLDNDEDGVLDTEEECDNEAEDKDGFEDEDGCPDLDNDEDGFADTEDACPVNAGVESAGGCPDEDGDSIMDSADVCPADKGPAETNGCPDSDEDGVVDSEDECKDEKGPIEAWGCPDADEDTVPDHRDECADEKDGEDTLSKYSNGCDTDVFVVNGQIVFKQPIAFVGTSDTIADESKPHLDAAAAILKKHEDLLLRLQVHADKGKSDDADLQLTKIRAASIKAVLLEAGIEGRRLGAKGHGSKEAKEGESNARIEFLVEQLVIEEEKPAEEAPADDKAEDKPAEEAPADDKAEDKPAEEAPADDKAEEKPAEEKPADE